MAGGFAHLILKKSHDKKFAEKQTKMDDILVFDDDLPNNCAVTFVDFAPTLKYAKDEGLKSVSYSELVDFSNKWLQRTGYWDVITCESHPAIIEVVVSDGGIIESKKILNTYSITDDPSQEKAIVYRKLSQSRVPVHFRVQLLRVWIRRLYTTPNDRIRPKIQFEDFVPKLIDDNVFENIDSVVERVNQSIKNGGIPGYIINVLTMDCCAEQDWSIDEESTQSKTWIGRIVCILRVFYIMGPKQEEEIGLADFVPECLSGGNLFKRPKFASQNTVLRKASEWLSSNKQFTFCSTASIYTKVKSLDSIDTKQMSMTRETGDYVRFVRIAYTKRKTPNDTTDTSALYLDGRAFVIHKSYSDIKRALADFMAKDEWTAQQPNRWVLLNSETIFVMSANGLKSSLESNCDQSFQSVSSSKLSINRNLFSAVKLYYDVGANGLQQINETPELSTSQSCALM